jgi:hypothetical protein
MKRLAFLIAFLAASAAHADFGAVWRRRISAVVM